MSENKPETPRPRKSTPAVLATFASFKRGRQELKTRLLQYPRSEPLIDIREYIQSDNFTGFSTKGLCFSYEELVQLEEMIPVMKKAMESV